MPLGNLTSQFFANVYLSKLDHFVKQILRAKYYIRYVDDFVILHSSKEQLQQWKTEINEFLEITLSLELHKDKSKIYPLSHGVDFVGFRNFFHFRLLRKRNINKIRRRIVSFEEGEYSNREISEIFQGWNAYTKWGNTFNLRRKVNKAINIIKKNRKSIRLDK